MVDEVAEILVIVLMFTVARAGVVSPFLEQLTIDVIAYMVSAKRRVLLIFFCMMMENFEAGILKERSKLKNNLEL